jgi:hypothetical protein
MVDKMLADMAPYLADMAPYLAAEGIDLDSLEESTELTSIMEALTRANQQYNLGRMTTTDAQRQEALDVLRRFTRAVAAGDEGAADDILDAVDIDPEDDSLAATQVVGTGLRLLDSWGLDAQLRGPLRSTRLPPWEVNSRAASRGVLALAKTSQAVATVNELIERYTGEVLYWGTALAVSSVVVTVASKRGIDVDQAIADLLGDQAPQSLGIDQSTPADIFDVRVTPGTFGSSDRSKRRTVRKGRGSGDPAKAHLSSKDRGMLKDFETWLRDQNPITATDDVEIQVGILTSIVSLAQSRGLDIHDPLGTEYLADEISLNLDDPSGDTDDADDAATAALTILTDYVHFRLDTSTDQEGWGMADETLHEALSQIDPIRHILGQVVEEASLINPADRVAVVMNLPLITAVSPLLKWIGSGKPVTSTGCLRRADIGTVAAMLGISAVGVKSSNSTVPPEQEALPGTAASPAAEPQTVYVTSMWDLPVLSQWWSVLQLCGLIDVTSTKVRPGLAAEQWLTASEPLLETADVIIGLFLGEYLTKDLNQWGILGRYKVMGLVARLVAALDPMQQGLSADDQPDQLQTFGDQDFAQLARLGLLTKNASGEHTVPATLRGPVATGLLLTFSIVTSSDEEE